MSSSRDESIDQLSYRLGYGQGSKKGNGNKENGTTNAKSVQSEEEDYHETEVKRTLKARHISMIALGGTIGTGLFIVISSPLQMSGPLGSLLAYIFIGTVVYSITQSLGEMATFIPVTSSVTVFSKRFLSPAFGVSNGYMYWFNWAITFAVELSVIGLIIQYWTTKVPIAVWIVVFWLLVTLVNFFPVRFYGEIEFWIASVKVVTIVGYLFYAFIIVCGGSSQGRIGFRYWRNPGLWGLGQTQITSHPTWARILGWLSSLIQASFTYQGTELVGISAGESRNPRKTVPRAINKVFFRILLFYILSLFFIGLLIPYDDIRLSSSGQTYVGASPFVISIQNTGMKLVPDIFNAVILLTVISAANSNVYVGSRVIYSLALSGNAPRQLSYVTKQGVPYLGVILTSLMGLMALLVVNNDAKTAFDWLVNISTLAGLCAWFFISLSHIRFMQCLKHRGINRDDLPFKAKFMPYSAYYSAIFIAILIFAQGYTAFAPTFDVLKFFTSYLSLILMVLVYACCQYCFKCRFLLKCENIDIDSDRRELDSLVWSEDESMNIWTKIWSKIF